MRALRFPWTQRGSIVPFGIGLPELLIVLLIILLLFGARRLPEMGRSLGQGMREFKDSVTGKDRGGERGERGEGGEEVRELPTGERSSVGSEDAAGAVRRDD
jgi:sec-independent protein translocase protein TatA